MRSFTFVEACAAYKDRFTCEHVPEWARTAQAPGRFYAPQYLTDNEWYVNTIFPGEPGSLDPGHAWSKNETWPHGKWLSEMFVPGRPARPYVAPATDGFADACRALAERARKIRDLQAARNPEDFNGLLAALERLANLVVDDADCAPDLYVEN